MVAWGVATGSMLRRAAAALARSGGSLVRAGSAAQTELQRWEAYESSPAGGQSFGFVCGGHAIAAARMQSFAAANCRSIMQMMG